MCHAYNFLILGIWFVISVGTRIPDSVRDMCLVNNLHGPIFLMDGMHDKVTRNLARVVQGSRLLGPALRGFPRQGFVGITGVRLFIF